MDFCHIDLAIVAPPLTADLVILFPSLCQRSSAAELILFALYFYFLCLPLLCDPFPLHCKIMADAFNPEFVCLPAPSTSLFLLCAFFLSYTRDRGFSWTPMSFCENSPKRITDPLLIAFFGSSHRISRGVQSNLQVTCVQMLSWFPTPNRINY